MYRDTPRKERLAIAFKECLETESKCYAESQNYLTLSRNRNYLIDACSALKEVITEREKHGLPLQTIEKAEVIKKALKSPSKLMISRKWDSLWEIVLPEVNHFPASVDIQDFSNKITLKRDEDLCSIPSKLANSLTQLFQNRSRSLHELFNYSEKTNSLALLEPENSEAFIEAYSTIGKLIEETLQVGGQVETNTKHEAIRRAPSILSTAVINDHWDNLLAIAGFGEGQFTSKDTI